LHHTGVLNNFTKGYFIKNC